MYQSLIVVDDFYARPMEVRRFALGCDYPAGLGQLTFPGRNSTQSFLPPGLDQVISSLAGEPLVGCGRPNVAHGRFRITLNGEPSRYLVHADPSYLTWVAVVYLNPVDHIGGGTTFYRHRDLQSDRVPSEAVLHTCGVASVAELLQRDGKDPGKWEHLMTVPQRFNRLVLYRPWLWHSAGESFGTSLDDGRLVHLLFFEPGGRPGAPAREPGP